MPAAELQLGSQIWVEPDDSAERIDHLCRTARGAGIGLVRVFLMWPWIEAVPGEWNFRVFDAVFDAAQAHGIGIKATLTANSAPWHAGTPSQLHTHTVFLNAAHRAAADRYITRCVERYRHHPALAQWILWNEPDGTGPTNTCRTTPCRFGRTCCERLSQVTSAH